MSLVQGRSADQDNLRSDNEAIRLLGYAIVEAIEDYLKDGRTPSRTSSSASRSRSGRSAARSESGTLAEAGALEAATADAVLDTATRRRTPSRIW